LSPPPKNVAILCNPLAGSGRARQCVTYILGELQARGIRHLVFDRNWPPDLYGFTEAWIAGGDGTVHYFINAYPELSIPFAVFPGGTGNDFHRFLYGHLSPGALLDRVLQSEPRCVDVGRCNGKYFLNIAGAGFEGSVVKSMQGRKKLPGKASFLWTVLRNIASYRPQYYEIAGDGIAATGHFLMVSVANGRTAGGGFRISPDSRIDDGLLNVVLVRDVPLLARLRYLPVIEKGQHLALPFVQHATTRGLVVTSDTPIPFHLDGEYAQDDSLAIDVLKHRVRVLY